MTGAATTYSVDSRAIYIQNKMTASAEGETQALQNGDVEGETKITIQVGSLSPLFFSKYAFVYKAWPPLMVSKLVTIMQLLFVVALHCTRLRLVKLR